MKFPRRKFLHLAAGAAALPAVSRVARAQAALPAVSRVARAQAYPARSVRIQ
jgi:hypothetical protein